MDTVLEEISPPPSPNIVVEKDVANTSLLNVDQFSPVPYRGTDGENRYDSPSSSRRSSAIIAVLRRPSQALALNAASALLNQRRYLQGLLNGHSDRSLSVEEKDEQDVKDEPKEAFIGQGDDALATILSALYAKLLVVLGIAFPITEIISAEVSATFYQGFYLYLYLGSMSFLILVYVILAREKALHSIISSIQKNNKHEYIIGKPKSKNVKRYGSFYLRLGAIAFGIGSMVYSGLEFGRYFELKNYPNCNANVLQAITPATRTILTLLQVQFIFLNSKDLQLRRHKIIARFGLMHMIATNLCEWLYVLVEETKHEIIHLAEHYNTNETIEYGRFCQKNLIMGSLITNASPFLFPCTIEYSLICAVILFEMWKNINAFGDKRHKGENKEKKEGSTSPENRTVSQFQFNQQCGGFINSENHFTVDCSNAHKGLFAGIMVIVLTIISLIMFFVLTQSSASIEDKRKHKIMAELEVNTVELVLYVITTIAVIVAMIQMRALKYDRKIGPEGQVGIGLDNTLLVVAQTGMFIYSMFSIIGCYFTSEEGGNIGLVAEIFSFIQTSFQTLFVLDGWWRRCRNSAQSKSKPGRQIITFLIVANMAMWIINTLEKNRAEFRPTHLKFFGHWAWTIITHISMPLAIFYRFHSTICLFEIWKSAFKFKSQMKSNLIPLL